MFQGIQCIWQSLWTSPLHAVVEIQNHVWWQNKDQWIHKQQEKVLQEKLLQIVTKGQIDKLFGIRSWHNDKPYPYGPRDAYKLTYKRLVYYLWAPVQGYRGVKQIAMSRNYKWRIFAMFNDPNPLTFAEGWTKAAINQIMTRDFPTQIEQAW